MFMYIYVYIFFSVRYRYILHLFWIVPVVPLGWMSGSACLLCFFSFSLSRVAACFVWFGCARRIFSHSTNNPVGLLCACVTE
jgi:hypothetical protein